MLECKVTFLDKTHIQFAKAQEDKVKIGKVTHCYGALESSFLKLYSDEHGKEEICTVNTAKMNPDLDKNANTLSLTFDGEQDPVLDIKAEVSTLERIEKYVLRRSQAKYKSPLCYTPAHRYRETIFTTGEVNTNLRGFLNLALIALIFAKFRDIIKNFMEYGMILTASIEISFTLSEFICFALSYLLPIFIAWWTEKMGLRKKISDKLVDIIEFLNVTGLVAAPIVLCAFLKPKPIPAIFYTTISIGNVLKLYSYIHVMHSLRRTVPMIYKLDDQKKDIVKELGEHEITRENLEIILKHRKDPSGLANIKDLIYFFSVPTFCYQLWYPRNPRIRWGYLAKRCVECFGCWALFTFVLNQYIMPIMDESVHIIEHGSFLEIIERMIRLSFPVSVCWILFFFGIFQYIFNIQAELQRFADRKFYGDWWNCRDLNEYWRLWNLPIHNFFNRHVYYPVLRKGYSRELAKLFVFLLSAIGHEYWASVPLRVVAVWAFISMIVQVPIMIIEQKADKILKGSNIGNVFFWISFCFVGQPTALVLYYQLYVRKHGG